MGVLRIINTEQIQAIGGSQVLAFSRHPAVQKIREPKKGIFFRRHPENGPRHQAHHFVEETTAVEGDRQQIAMLLRNHFPQGPGGVLGPGLISPEGGKAGKVMSPGQAVAGLFEFRGIKRLGPMRGYARFMRREHRARIDPVAIGFSEGVKAGMEIRPHR